MNEFELYMKPIYFCEILSFGQFMSNVMSGQTAVKKAWNAI